MIQSTANFYKIIKNRVNFEEISGIKIHCKKTYSINIIFPSLYDHYLTHNQKSIFNIFFFLKCSKM